MANAQLFGNPLFQIHQNQQQQQQQAPPLMRAFGAVEDPNWLNNMMQKYQHPAEPSPAIQELNIMKQLVFDAVDTSKQFPLKDPLDVQTKQAF